MAFWYHTSRLRQADGARAWQAIFSRVDAHRAVEVGIDAIFTDDGTSIRCARASPGRASGRAEAPPGTAIVWMFT